MMLKNSLGGLALVASLLAGAGCVATVHGHVDAPVAVVEVQDDPPPPRNEVIEVRPGFVHIEGRWVNSGGRWDWRAGYYERERVGYSWEAGRWETRGRNHVWVEGRWRNGGGNRDHREERQGGTVVRDHR
ncbi:MAG: hypothetical protein ABI591_02380 [Kofleriaceae bacterium]